MAETQTETAEDILIRVLRDTFDPATKSPRERYALGIASPEWPGQPVQFIAAGLLGHGWQLTPDLDRSHRWESVEAIREWINTTPDRPYDTKGKEGPSVLDRLRGKHLFVFRVRTVAEQLVAAWQVTERLAAPEKGGNGNG